MKAADALKIIMDLGSHFPGLVPADTRTPQAWAKTLADCDDEAVRRAAKIMANELETIYPGSNLGAMLRNRANPTITEATVMAHLNRAVEMAGKPEGRPYEYLRQIDKRLLEMADRADMFNRSITSESLRFMVRDVAKQYIEERSNAKKGFLPPNAIGPERQLPEPPKGMTEEQRLLGRSKVQELRKRLGSPERLGDIAKSIVSQEKPEE